MNALAVARLRIPLLRCLGAIALLAFCRLAVANGADLPPEIIVQGYLKVEDARIVLLVRVPLVLLSSFSLPKRGPGYLDLAHMDAKLAQAAAATAKQILLRQDAAASTGTVRKARISVLADRSFTSYAGALASIEGPALPADTDLFWNQGFFDAEVDYRLQSPAARLELGFNISPELGQRIKLRLQYLPTDRPARVLELPGGSGWVALDPRWYQTAWLFAVRGFLAAFSLQRSVFILCLVAPFRHFPRTLGAVGVLALLQAVTLTLAAAKLAGDTRWLPALFDWVCAAAVMLLAIANLATPVLRRRVFLSAVVGALGGFVLSNAFSELSLSAGANAAIALAAYAIGAALGVLALGAIALGFLRAFLDRVLGTWLGLIVISALLGHLGWHWLVEASSELPHELGHAAAGGLPSLLRSTASWLLPAAAVGVLAAFLPKRFDPPALTTLLGAFMQRR